MILARVVGTVVATRKDDRLHGRKLLLVVPLDESGQTVGTRFVAVDGVQAGSGETVLVVQGSSARLVTGFADTPVDATIVGIVDQIAVEAK